MRIIINNTTYNNISWNGNGFSIETAMTLAEVESSFIPGTDTNIIVYDGEQKIARYYNKGISSVMVSGSTPRVVTVTFNLTQISANAETEIRSDLDDTDGAIIELAEIISELSELDMPGMEDKVQSHQETLDTWFSTASEIGSFIDRLREENGILDQFNMRIAALEHEIGIVSVVRNDDSGEVNDKGSEENNG